MARAAVIAAKIDLDRCAEIRSNIFNFAGTASRGKMPR
ncbi:hypothetical protein Ga0609869_002925 [Rhodovulum iodosum]|uniref:Uncharacterized protein n=1 Tax=Rhodovulum iodosum TaxID=68291 RepID=A0ABV3XW42_9RHOB